MPQLQVVDLRPWTHEGGSPLEKTVGAFAKRYKENEQQRMESDELRQIYSQYQQDGRNIEDAIIAMQTNPGISPTTRVNNINQLLQAEKFNTERVKKAQADAEKAEKKSNNQQIIKDIEQRRNLEPGSLSAYEDNPAMAANITKPEKNTQASQPINEDQLRRIQHVESQPEFESADLPTKQRMLRNAGVSKENSNSILTPYSEQAKIENESAKLERAEEKAFHKESEKFDEEINKSATSAGHQLKAIEDSKKALSSGNVRPTSFANIFRGLGSAGDKISNALMSSDEATIQASIPAFLEGRKELFGVRLSDADLRLLQDKLPDIGKSKQANIAILNLMQKSAQESMLKAQIAKEIKKNNKGLRPLGYREMIEEVFAEKTIPVKMISPAGYEVAIPAYQVEDAIKAGGKLQNE